MEFAKKKYKISFVGGPTTPTYSIYYFVNYTLNFCTL